MKITEITIVPSKSKDTISCDTTSSVSKGGPALDIVPQNIVPEMIDDTIVEHPDHSAIAEGVSQIFRRKKGGAPTKGFRCTSGPRKGRIVASPSTCFAKFDPQKSAKIRKKRAIKAKVAGKKLGITKRARGGSLRLKGAQIKKSKAKGPGASPMQKSKGVKRKSSILK